MEDSGKTFGSEEEETNYWRDLAMTYKQRLVLQCPSLLPTGRMVAATSAGLSYDALKPTVLTQEETRITLLYRDP